MNPEKYGITPDPSKDQHFLTDKDTIKRIVMLARPKKGDTILEIGAGVGTLTGPLARTGAKVIAIEMDRNLKKALDGLDYPNLKVIYRDALEVMGDIGFSKLVSNTPYSICEPLLNRLMGRKFELAVLSVPEGFYRRISSKEGNDRYSLLSFKAEVSFRTSLEFSIPREHFRPMPGTGTVVVVLKPIPEKAYSREPYKYIIREIFLRERMKVRNSLMEGLIRFNGKVLGKEFTKNMARGLIRGYAIPENILDKRGKDMDLKDFRALRKRIRVFS